MKKKVPIQRQRAAFRFQKQVETSDPEIQLALPMKQVESEGKRSLRIRVGRALEKREGVRFGDEQYHLEKQLDSHSKRKQWRVVAGS